MSRKKRTIVVYHEELCMSCRSCELACSLSHTTSKNIYKAVEAQEKPARRRWMKTAPGIRVSLGCQHCIPAPCVQACISGALYKGPDGETLHDAEKCVGCWMCMMVCSFGAIKRLKATHKIAKCDLCGMEDDLACVQACPTKALKIHIVEDEPDYANITESEDP